MSDQNYEIIGSLSLYWCKQIAPKARKLRGEFVYLTTNAYFLMKGSTALLSFDTILI